MYVLCSPALHIAFKLKVHELKLLHRFITFCSQGLKNGDFKTFQCPLQPLQTSKAVSFVPV